MLREPRKLELLWYRKHGKHKSRIVKDADGRDYVIGDEAWNKQHPDKIEFMENAIRY